MASYGEDSTAIKRRAVGQRHDHFPAVVAIGVAIIRRPCGDPHCSITHRERQDAHEDVGCAGEKREAPGPYAAGDLGDQS